MTRLQCVAGIMTEIDSEKWGKSIGLVQGEYILKREECSGMEEASMNKNFIVKTF